MLCFFLPLPFLKYENLLIQAKPLEQVLLFPQPRRGVETGVMQPHRKGQLRIRRKSEKSPHLWAFSLGGWPAFPQPRTEWFCSIRGERDGPPGFRAHLGSPRVVNARKEPSKYFPESSFLSSHPKKVSSLRPQKKRKKKRVCGSLWLCDALPTFSQCFSQGKFYFRNLWYRNAFLPSKNNVP